MEFYFQSNSVLNSLKCPKSLSHCLTELFQIYQNKPWTIRWRDGRSVGPSSHRIILKIVGFQVPVKNWLYLRKRQFVFSQQNLGKPNQRLAGLTYSAVPACSIYFVPRLSIRSKRPKTTKKQTDTKKVSPLSFLLLLDPLKVSNHLQVVKLSIKVEMDRVSHIEMTKSKWL